MHTTADFKAALSDAHQSRRKSRPLGSEHARASASHATRREPAAGATAGPLQPRLCHLLDARSRALYARPAHASHLPGAQSRRRLASPLPARCGRCAPLQDAARDHLICGVDRCQRPHRHRRRTSRRRHCRNQRSGVRCHRWLQRWAHTGRHACARRHQPAGAAAAGGPQGQSAGHAACREGGHAPQAGRGGQGLARKVEGASAPAHAACA